MTVPTALVMQSGPFAVTNSAFPARSMKRQVALVVRHNYR